MRLEKTLYERLLNVELLGRARKFTKPTKFYAVNPHYYMMAKAYHHNQHTSFLWKIFGPIMERFFMWNAWTFRRDLELRRGYVPDDTQVHNEWDLRRGIFLEHVDRESFHPYYWLFYCFRRRRYWKVERVIQGFEVPEWIRKDVEKRTLFDAMSVERQYNDFVHENFWSDMSPTSGFGRGKYNPLEMLSPFGVFRNEAWERLFFNEKHYSVPEKELWDEAFRNHWGCDLTTEDGRRKFESKVNDWVTKYPGMIVPEGEKYNFKRHYAIYALKYRQDTSKFSQEELEEAKKILDDRIARKERLQLDEPEEKAKKTGMKPQEIGSEIPSRLRHDHAASFMN